jgi:CRISPR-associated protein Csx3
MSYPSAGRFPAILIGGPPHSGKSVLAQSLTKALTQAHIQHYLLRAAPDGEGNWFHEADRAVAEKLRRKGKYTPAWIERMCRDIAARPLPFLVDIGGRPERWQEAMIDQCTHAILLTTDDASLAEWQERVAQYNLLVIASLTSRQTGESYLAETGGPIIRGVISRLERGQPAAGPVFEAVLNRVKALFGYSYDELLSIHTEQAPVELVVDLPAMYRQLNPTRADYKWQPADLPGVFEYLPQDAPLALYGRGPAWLYAAVANHIFPQPFYQFDARRGWVKPIRLNTSATAKVPVNVTVEPSEPYLHLKLDLPEDYLIYQPELSAPLPPPSQTQGVVLDGKLPNWLYPGLTLFYRSALWVAIYYPPLNQAIVVAVQGDGSPYTVGHILSGLDTPRHGRPTHSG